MNNANIGRLIRIMRVEKKLGQVAMAQAAGISQSTLSAMENGAALTRDNLARVAQVLGTTAGMLLDADSGIDERPAADQKAVALADDLARLLDPTEMDALFAKASGNRPMMASGAVMPKPAPIGAVKKGSPKQEEGGRLITVQATIEFEEKKSSNKTTYVYKGAKIEGPAQAAREVKTAFGKMMKPVRASHGKSARQ